MEIVILLAINAGVALACFIALWAASIPLKDPSFVDSWWPMGMVVMAVTSFLVSGERGPHAVLLMSLCAVWGLRLGVYLFFRRLREGPDGRYTRMMGKAKAERGWDYPLASLILVFALQLPLQWIVALPAQLGQVSTTTALGPIGVIGAVVAVTGIAFETIGDWQLASFKANPENKGKVLDTGLWRYTRHPNYFGDVALWWGLWLIAAETGIGAWSLPGPILLTFLLTRFSGVPTTEGRMRRRKPDYEAYVARTSSFVPWFPKG